MKEELPNPTVEEYEPWLVAFLIVVCVLMLSAVQPVYGQTAPAPTPTPVVHVTTDAATRIADAAQPTTLLVDAAVKCAVIGDKATRKFCLDLIKVEAIRGMKVANEAADATKNSRSGSSCGGWFSSPAYCATGGYGGYYGYGYGGGGYYGGSVHTTGGGYVTPYGAGTSYRRGVVVHPPYYGGTGTGVTPYGASRGGGAVPSPPPYNGGGGGGVTPYQPPR